MPWKEEAKKLLEFGASRGYTHNRDDKLLFKVMAELEGVIIRVNPIGVGLIFHVPSGHTYPFKCQDLINLPPTASKRIGLVKGKTVQFQLKEGRSPSHPKTAIKVKLLTVTPASPASSKMQARQSRQRQEEYA